MGLEGETMSWNDLRSGRDRVIAMADRSGAAEAVAELVWNALDGDAKTVELFVETNELGAATTLIVVDNGRGIEPGRVVELFATEGDSWKATEKFSPDLRRPLHGRFGRGRLLSYAIAQRSEWSTISETSSGNRRTVVVGDRARPSGFEIGEPEPTDMPTGTIVRLDLLASQKAAQLADDGFELRLIERLAESLQSVGADVRWQGRSLDPEASVASRSVLALPLIDGLPTEHPLPTLSFVEWLPDVGSKRLMICGPDGTTLTEFKPTSTPPVPFTWTAYLSWAGFRDPKLMTTADLHVPEVQHGELLRACEDVLAKHLVERLNQVRGRIITDWKSEGVYPYAGTAASKLEEAERDLFDVVAVIASRSIPSKGTDQKKLSLRLLRESLRAAPTSLGVTLRAILQLTPEDADNLQRLLNRTTLASIVRSAHQVADRLDFIEGLGSALYSDETTKQFREVDQLHPMLVAEPWVFGDEWSHSLSEHGLTKVVRSAVEVSGERLLALDPIRLPDGRRGRVDMLFHRHHPESRTTRHLVVELKRPGKLTMDHYGQVMNYAAAITDHPEVKGAHHVWSFWLVGSDTDGALDRQRSQDPLRPGLAHRDGSVEVCIVTWGELLEGLRRKYRWYRDNLDIPLNEETGLAYLRRIHAEYAP
jgi:hypothetical protein